jgi:hypothetical protein
MEFLIINFESPYYEQVLSLRNKVLRAPLGLKLNDEDLKEDREQIIVILLKNDQLLASLQLKPLSKSLVKLRQMAVYDTVQRQGLGSLLIGYAENFCLLNDYTSIELHAREVAVPFYERLGFNKVSDVFMEVGIPHYKMMKQLSAVSSGDAYPDFPQ